MIGRDTGLHDFTIRLVLERDRTVEFHGPADITSETSDAIVNAANSSLLGGGGVDGAIHQAGGPAILAECRQIVSRIGSLPAGQAVITSGGNLPAKYVIHTVGPVYRGGEQGEPEKLASCHRECIRLADEHGLQSLSFPAISTGAYGYPVSEAAVIALSSTLASLDAAKSLRVIRFVLFDIATLRAYTRVVEKPGNLDLNSSYRIEKRAS
jgi:O-acetyl-ADP-ribose deacetylase (regulator of RNase III)